MKSVSDSMTKTGKTLSVTMTAPITGFAAAIGKISIDFEKQMSNVKGLVALNSTDIEADMARLEAAAREMGATTKFSATEAAQGLEFMALAGYSVNESIETLPKVLSLATAGNLDLAYASDLVTDIGSSLNLTLEETDELLDKMAKSSASSNMSVGQVGEAMLTVGGTANTLSGGLTEVTTALGILANNGVKGSEGGTALRNTILSLTAPTDKAAGAMAELGIGVADAEQNMLPLDNIMNQFNRSLTGLGKVEKQAILNQIFNKVDLKSISALMASTAMNMDEVNKSLTALGIDTETHAEMLNYLAGTFELNEDKSEFCSYAMQEMGITMQEATTIYDELNRAVGEGSTAWGDLAGKIDDSKGACSDMSDIMNDNLDGTLKTIGSALEELALQFGDILLPVFKRIAVILMEGIQFLQGLSEETKRVIAIVAAVVAAIGPLLLIGAQLIKGFMTLSGWVTKVSAAVTEFGGVMAIITNPITIAIASIVALVTTITYLYHTNEDVKASIDACWEAIKTCFESAFDFISRVVEVFIDAFQKSWDKYGEYIMEAIRETWDIVEKVFQVAFDIITDIFNIFSALFKGDWEALWENVKTLVDDVWFGILQIVKEWLEGIVSSLVNIGGVLFLKAVEAFMNIKQGFSETWDKIVAWFEKAKEDPVEMIKSIFTSMYDAGSNVINYLWEGLKASWNKVGDWFEEKTDWIKNKFTLFKSQAEDIVNTSKGVDGSHRTGLNEVPYDGYVAQLHKGERVLTQSEAKRYESQQQQQTIISSMVDTSKMENLLERMNRTLDRLPQNLQSEKRMGLV